MESLHNHLDYFNNIFVTVLVPPAIRKINGTKFFNKMKNKEKKKVELTIEIISAIVLFVSFKLISILD